MKIFPIIGFITLFALACNSEYVPKPRGYFKIDFPRHEYKLFDQPGYPYKFEYPVYANIVKDSTFFEDKPENDYWINVEFPRFQGKIYISYKEISKNSFDKLKEDAYKMTYKHTIKASSIRDSVMTTPLGISGIFFYVGGNAATGRQFYLTDTTKNFLRGALYFDAAPNDDSLSVVNNFLQEDLRHLINSFKWK